MGEVQNTCGYGLLDLCQYFVLEEIANCFGRNGMECFVNGDAYTLLAVTEAESTSEFYLITDIVFGDQLLELFYDLTGSFDVAGTSDANCDLHKLIPRILNFDFYFFVFNCELRWASDSAKFSCFKTMSLGILRVHGAKFHIALMPQETSLSQTS